MTHTPQIIGTLQLTSPVVQRKYTYLLNDTTGIVQYIGEGYLTDIVTLKTVKKLDRTKSYQVSIYEDISPEDAINTLNAGIVPPLNAVQTSAEIECIELGSRYRNAYEVAKVFGLSHSALSNHLNGKVGFKSVKGFTFKRVGQ